MVNHLKFIILLGLLSLLVSCANKDKNNKNTAHHHFKIGVSLSAKGQKSKSLQQLLMAHELDPSNTLILNHLGMAYYFLKEYGHAIVTLKEAVRINPDHSEAHNNLGRMYIEIKDFHLARKHLAKASSDLTYSHKDKVWLNFGLSYFFEGKYKQSEIHLLKALENNDKNCLAHSYYGRSQMELKKFKQAIRAFNKAIHYCGKKHSYEPRYYGALSLFHQGHQSKALSFLSDSRKHFSGLNLKKIDKMIKQMKVSR